MLQKLWHKRKTMQKFAKKTTQSQAINRLFVQITRELELKKNRWINQFKSRVFYAKFERKPIIGGMNFCEFYTKYFFFVNFIFHSYYKTKCYLLIYYLCRLVVTSCSTSSDCHINLIIKLNLDRMSSTQIC